jgi:hypothetical protein
MDNLITYGDIYFEESKKRLVTQAKKIGFLNCRAYSPFDLSKEFINSTSEFITLKKGGGYWLWKPFILKDTFDTMHYDEVLVYLDAGCEINIHAKNRLYEYIELAKENNGLLSFYLKDKREYMYTNQNTFDYFNIKTHDDIYNSFQLSANVLIFVKTRKSELLVNKFYQIAVESPYLFADFTNEIKDHRFIQHRHDQSIFSILRKQFDSVLIEDETYSSNWDDLKAFPFHAKRIRDNSKIQLILNILKYNFRKIYSKIC